MASYTLGQRVYFTVGTGVGATRLAGLITEHHPATQSYAIWGQIAPGCPPIERLESADAEESGPAMLYPTVPETDISPRDG